MDYFIFIIVSVDERMNSNYTMNKTPHVLDAGLRIFFDLRVVENLNDGSTELSLFLAENH